MSLFLLQLYCSQSRARTCKTLLLFCALFLTFYLQSNAQNNGYHIKVSIADAQNEQVFLAHYFGDKQYIRDTIVLDAKGNGAFKGTELLKGGVYLIVFENRSYFELMIDKEQNFSLSTKKANPNENLRISGSSENQLFLDFISFLAIKNKEVEALKAGKSDSELNQPDILKQVDKINNEVTAFKAAFLSKNPDLFFTKLLKATEDPIVPQPPILPSGQVDSMFGYWYFRTHYFDNFDLSDHRLLRSPIYHRKLMFFLEKLIPPVADSVNAALDQIMPIVSQNEETFRYVVATLSSYYERSEIMGFDAVFVHLVNQFYRTRQTPWVDEATLLRIVERADMLMPNLLGKKAPPLTLPNVEQKPISLYSLKNQLTIVYFWDSGCGHCKKITPEIKKLYDKYKSKGLGVYAVNIEQEKVNWIKYIGENDLNFINVIDVENKSNFRRLYDITSTPIIFLLDSEKRILGKKLTPEQTEDFIKRELKIP